MAAARRLPRAGQKRNAQRRALGKAARAAASRWRSRDASDSGSAAYFSRTPAESETATETGIAARTLAVTVQ